MMGILSASSRIDLVIENKPGEFKKALQVVHDHGGEIINVGQTAQKDKKRNFFFRLAPCKTDIIRSALENQGFHVIDAMD
jgi:acetoin utilization protein AcuB